MTFDPKPGLVVRYDFLWKEESQAGIESGKDRPCAIVLTSAEKPDGSKDILLCAITHSAPHENEMAVKVPPKVARHIGLDDKPSWIKTDQVNRLTWQKGRIPYGVSQAKDGPWAFGDIPEPLARQAFEQVREKSRNRSLKVVGREGSSTGSGRASHNRRNTLSRPQHERGHGKDDADQGL